MTYIWLVILNFALAAYAAAYDFSGIVKIGNCSGSLIRFERSLDADFALVLTNGHCLETGFLYPGDVVLHRPSSRAIDLLDGESEPLGTLKATEIIYATSDQTDIALYRLAENYRTIRKKFGTEALVLSSRPPAVGQSIEIISGYWQRGYSCSVEAIVPTLKDDVWTWRDSIRYSRPGCEIIAGTSGSPILLLGTREVIGINNDYNKDGEACTYFNPCEVASGGGVTYEKGFAYGQQTALIYSCMNAQNELDLGLAGCNLVKK